jgi:hypothetical protein
VDDEQRKTLLATKKWSGWRTKSWNRISLVSGASARHNTNRVHIATSARVQVQKEKLACISIHRAQTVACEIYKLSPKATPSCNDSVLQMTVGDMSLKRDGCFRCKAVPLHAMVALGGRGGIAPTHSRLRHYMGVSGQHHAPAALYPGRKDLRYPLYRRLGGPQSRSGHRG